MVIEFRNPFKRKLPDEKVPVSQAEIKINPEEEKKKKIEVVQGKMQGMLDEVVDGVLDGKVGGVEPDITQKIQEAMNVKILQAFCDAGIMNPSKSSGDSTGMFRRHKARVEILKGTSDRKGSDGLKVAKQGGVESMGTAVFSAKVIFEDKNGKEKILAKREFRAGNIISENNRDLYEKMIEERAEEKQRRLTS